MAMQLCKLFIAFLYIVSNHRWTGAGAFENRREIRHIFLGRALPRKRQAFQFPHLAVNRSNFNLTPYKIFSEIRPYLIHPQIETTWKPYKCKFKGPKSRFCHRRISGNWNFLTCELFTTNMLIFYQKLFEILG